MYRRIAHGVGLLSGVLAAAASSAPIAAKSAAIAPQGAPIAESASPVGAHAGSGRAPGREVTTAIDRYIRAQMRLQRIPGLTLAVVRDGEPIYVRGYGVATLEHDVAAEPRTVYQLGSIGKQFTAVALMMLADEHRLELDDPLSKYLPEVPASWRKVTLRLMLNHQSGIPQFTTPQRQLLDLAHDYSDKELIELAAAQPLDFEPGTDVSYSDTGYVLLGFVINRVAGMFYGEFLRQRVFAPLRMSRTRVISDADIVADRASGYELTEQGALRNQSYVSPALNRTADGSLYSNVLDLAKWDRALYGDAVLPQRELERMWSVDAHANGQRPLYHYGYGWENNRLRGHRLVEYDGNWQGFQAVMSRYVDKRLTVILLTNLSLCRTERMGHAVAGFIDPELSPYPEEIRDTDPESTAKFRAFLERSDDGGGDLLTAHARALLFPAAMSTLRRDRRERGPILKFTLAQQARSVRVYRAEERDMVEFYSVAYAADGRVDDIDLLSEY